MVAEGRLAADAARSSADPVVPCDERKRRSVMKPLVSQSDAGNASTQVWRFLASETGDDLIEYALLTSVIGAAGVLAFNLLGSAINTAYSNWNGNVQNLWQPPAPAPKS
jgi:Flp pilus assembly pilin Flp